VATMEVHVTTPEREVWVGEASLVVARAVDGDIGILPGHIPVLTALAIGILTIKHGDDRPTRAVVDGGFLHVTTGGGDTRVDILAEHAELADDIDLSAAEYRREQAERRLAEGHGAEARAELAKALVRLRARG
jgi:F-type H+-transporting ATPase subunit epsilon